MTALCFSQARQKIFVPGDQVVLGHDANGITRSLEHLKTAARQLQFRLDRLVAIGDAAAGEHLWHPTLRSEFLFQQPRCIQLHHDFRLEIDARIEPEILVRRPGIAVSTAMFHSRDRDSNSRRTQCPDCCSY